MRRPLVLMKRRIPYMERKHERGWDIPWNHCRWGRGRVESEGWACASRPGQQKGQSDAGLPRPQDELHIVPSHLHLPRLHELLSGPTRQVSSLSFWDPFTDSSLNNHSKDGWLSPLTFKSCKVLTGKEGGLYLCTKGVLLTLTILMVLSGLSREAFFIL